MADGSTPDLIVRRRDAFHVRAVRDADREVDFIASTDTIDSFDEIVDQASWDLTRFEKNPIILYQHDRWSLPLGQATRCEVVKGQLEITVKFASADANPQAEQVFKLVQEKVLRAVSVGFKPMDGKYEMRDGRDVYVLYNCELRECSIVTVPANEDCLAQMKSASLATLLDCQILAAEVVETMRAMRTPDNRERIRSAITLRDAPKTTPELPAPSLTNTEAAKIAAEQNQMDLKEATERLEKSEKALVDAKVAEKAASDKAAAHEARIKAVETERDSALAASATLKSEHEKACADRDANLARATKAEGDVIALEVKDLVGKKIAPTEVDDFVKLRTDNPGLFTSMVAKRPDMKLLETVIPKTEKSDANGATPPALGSDAGSEYFRSL